MVRVSGRRWSIGQLARASGVTVRTLHYYDEIGLVSPAERTPAGHRRYVEADIRRLYRVRALSELGLSLDQVATALNGGEADELDSVRDLLTAQLADLERQTGRIEESKQRIRAMLDQLAGSVMPEPEQFLTTLEPLQVDLDRYLTRAQQTAMTANATTLGTATLEALKAEWIDLFTQLRQHLRDGTPADDERVRALARRWRELVATFGTDPHLKPAIQAIWQDNGIGEQLDQRLGWQGPAGTTEILAYLEKAK